jgi:hypothetical protein
VAEEEIRQVAALVDVFWDLWRLGDLQLGDYTAWLEAHARVEGDAPFRFVQHWTTLYARWCEAEKRPPLILIESFGSFSGRQLREGDALVLPTLPYARSARVRAEVIYTILDARVPRGVIADGSGAGFVWQGGYLSNRHWAQELDDAALALWGGNRIISFFSRLGGQQITRRFWQRTPHLAGPVQLAVRRVMRAPRAEAEVEAYIKHRG